MHLLARGIVTVVVVVVFRLWLRNFSFFFSGSSSVRIQYNPQPRPSTRLLLIEATDTQARVHATLFYFLWAVQRFRGTLFFHPLVSLTLASSIPSKDSGFFLGRGNLTGVCSLSVWCGEENRGP